MTGPKMTGPKIQISQAHRTPPMRKGLPTSHRVNEMEARGKLWEALARLADSANTVLIEIAKEARES